MTKKYDWIALEHQFIEGGEDVTHRSIAKEIGASNSTVSAYAKLHGWEEKRARFRAETEERFLSIRSEQRARKLAVLAERGVDLLEAMMVQAAQRVVNNTLEMSAKDALDAISKVQLLRGEATERTEGRQVHAHVLDARALDALEELARRQLEPIPVGGDKPKLLTG